jgi:hypothetical protein
MHCAVIDARRMVGADRLGASTGLSLFDGNAAMSVQAKTVVVTGDFTLDWNPALGQKLGTGSRTMSSDSSTRQRWQRGGAALLADLMTAVAKKIGDGKSFEVRALDAPRRAEDGANVPIGPESDQFHHSTALWMQYEYAPNDKDHKDEKEKLGA